MYQVIITCAPYTYNVICQLYLRIAGEVPVSDGACVFSAVMATWPQRGSVSLLATVGSTVTVKLFRDKFGFIKLIFYSLKL